MGRGTKRKAQPADWDVPANVHAFLEDKGVDVEALASSSLPRFVRLNPFHPIEFDELKRQLEAANNGAETGLVTTALDGVLKLLGSIKIAGTSAYRSGSIYGIDISSALAAEALGAEPGHAVLDLCCAPGAKLCTIADTTKRTGVLVGVDVSMERMNTCRNIMSKYGIGHAELLVADASVVHLRRLFDRVLVDAECTHDGSIKHLVKYATTWGWDSFERRVLDHDRLSTLRDLQERLLVNGFEHLKPGGRLIYSTCSLSDHQNEEVVQALLRRRPAARLVPVRIVGVDFEASALEHAVRLTPSVSGTSGMFIACLEKVPEEA